MKYANWPHHADFVQTPLPVLTMVMLVLGIQFFLMGLLAEMQVRTYHESQAKAIYAVRERINFTTEDTRRLTSERNNNEITARWLMQHEDHSRWDQDS